MTKVCTKVTITSPRSFPWSFLSSARRRREVIDRIVAIVNGQIILQSDRNDALRYEGLLSARAERLLRGRPEGSARPADRPGTAGRANEIGADQARLGRRGRGAVAEARSSIRMLRPMMAGKRC